METATSDYEFHRLLAVGRNGSSRIFEVSYKGKRCALKRILARTARDLILTDRERSMLLHIDSQRALHGRRFLVRLIRAIQTSPVDLHLLFPLAPGGDLFEQRQLRPERVFTEVEARHYLAELACALKFLHVTCEIVHRDVKSENVLLDEHGHILLADFDLSTRVDPIRGVKHEACGTLETVAPECVPPRCETTFASDIYALGMLAMELVIGHSRKIPENLTEDEAFALIARGEREKCEGRTSDQFSRFVNRLLSVTPSNRPTAAQLREMPFFDAVNGWSAIEWEKVLRRKSVAPKVISRNADSSAEDKELFGICRSANEGPDAYTGRYLDEFHYEALDNS